ncbi:AI-2E family transporter [Nitrosomonas communis]|uniref:Predicted PurR-regulated permease PerM n=1 Tax=Nitrosomonas communis TaxID=44574 RepID=A0A1H2ZD00_9PROT|nr:AI-2E family transporter [Nitrosomonas communis]SDX15207.1 Predicted PurR-regulated permease PerM [Nitrosomonas communis]
MNIEERIVQCVQLAAITIIFYICYQILHPFIAAILFAVVICLSTWPLYQYLNKAIGDKPALASLLMIALLIMLIIIPSALLAISLGSNVSASIEAAKVFLGHGPIEAPAWLADLPIFGARLDSYWQGLFSGGNEAVILFKELLDPIRNFLINLGNIIGQSLLQMVFAAFIGFFFYRDGEALIQILRKGMVKLLGFSFGVDPLATIHNIVTGVVYGIFGAASAQAIAATIGFFIAGVPGAFLLGAATFVLSVIPMGPALLWGGASVWFVYQESYGWAIFMALWGAFVISSIDNFVKPYLISRESKLSLLLIVLGVTGGITAYGFIGIFIGPPILAVGIALIQQWTEHSATSTNNPP